MEDTLARARQEREKQGTWEVEISYGEEADLHRLYRSCGKNPGHHNFIPAYQFNVDHLPPRCHDKELVMDYVRAMSDLTVRVSVKHVSDSRSEAVRLNGLPFPCYNSSGGNMMRVGTGFVRKVTNNKDHNISCKTCHCHECLTSPTPKTHFAYIQIFTAAHVVYDDLEAADTTCHLFFDKGDTPDTCSGVVTLSGLSVMMKDVTLDFCKMRYVTHDMDLAKRLAGVANRWYALRKTLFDKNRLAKFRKQKLAMPVDELAGDSEKLNIIVSHPHGCSKQVSIGRYIGMDERDKDVSPLMYTTATCPGSSGAHVVMVNEDRCLSWGNLLVHCGHSTSNKNLNFSSLHFLTYP